MTWNCGKGKVSQTVVLKTVIVGQGFVSWQTWGGGEGAFVRGGLHQGLQLRLGCLLLSLLLGGYSPDEEGVWPRGPRGRHLEVQSTEVCDKC